MNRNISELKKINRLFKKVSNLNESISFDDDIMEDDDSFDDYDIQTDSENEFPDKHDSEDLSKNGSNVECQNNSCDDLVNKIRKMALSGMSELAENTDNPNYEILKKIWQFCDKKITDDKKTTENNI